MTASHTSKAYFTWQAPIGEFGGWAKQPTFAPFVSPKDQVLDFGCGGGWLLAGLDCAERFGVEPNPEARAKAIENGLTVFPDAREVSERLVDVVISSHALEHTREPLRELKELYRILKPGGQLVLTVPCESASRQYRAGDINQHLYSWSPMCLGNVVTEAGFEVERCHAYRRTWPHYGYRLLARFGGRKGFELGCWLYGLIYRRICQIRVIARRPV